MSFAENDRNFRSENGKTFHHGPIQTVSSARFREEIAAALRRDFGGAPAAVKQVAKLVDANERAVRNWFDGRNGPSGQHLVRLMARSPAVVESVLALSGRTELVRSQLVADARNRVQLILAMLDALVEA